MGKQRKEEIRAKRTEKSKRESEGWREEGREKGWKNDGCCGERI